MDREERPRSETVGRDACTRGVRQGAPAAPRRRLPASTPRAAETERIARPAARRRRPERDVALRDRSFRAARSRSRSRRHDPTRASAARRRVRRYRDEIEELRCERQQHECRYQHEQPPARAAPRFRSLQTVATVRFLTGASSRGRDVDLLKDPSLRLSAGRAAVTHPQPAPRHESDQPPRRDVVSRCRAVAARGRRRTSRIRLSRASAANLTVFGVALQTRQLVAALHSLFRPRSGSPRSHRTRRGIAPAACVIMRCAAWSKSRQRATSRPASGGVWRRIASALQKRARD
jgi:hypothetical protein